jgi:hypothetical protein
VRGGRQHSSRALVLNRNSSRQPAGATPAGAQLVLTQVRHGLVGAGWPAAGPAAHTTVAAARQLSPPRPPCPLQRHPVPGRRHLLHHLVVPDLLRWRLLSEQGGLGGQALRRCASLTSHPLASQPASQPASQAVRQPVNQAASRNTSLPHLGLASVTVARGVRQTQPWDNTPSAAGRSRQQRPAAQTQDASQRTGWPALAVARLASG